MLKRATIAFVIALCACGVGHAQQVQPQLSVLGEGRSAAVPDMATIQMGVTHSADTAAEALDMTNIATGELLTLLSELGIEPEDMQTNNLSLSPLWQNRSSSSEAPEIVGYQADNSITLRVRSLPDLGAILDDVIASGANTFRGLTFGLQDAQPIRDAARRAAVEDARRKAALYAAAAGLSLGPIMSISEPGVTQGPPSFEMAGLAMARSDVPVAAGELSLQAQVIVIYSIISN